MNETITALPLRLSTQDDSDEFARAEVYGLLAQLFYSAPDAALYSRLQVAPTAAPAPGGFLESSWMEVVAASRRRTQAETAQEYDAMFAGIGKPDIFLYGSHHIAGSLNEKPLVALRDSLRVLGLARTEAMTETEDHFAYLCEVMRYLIAGGDVGVSNLASQQRFFNAHVRPWAGAMLEQVAAHPAADFYRAIAVFARDFLSVEGQGFDMLD
ncbi:MAG: molecular chaperone TorD family protein [Burkholderiales bacterium]|jgi:TorA maturation chaperone TorD|nr:molecular chaperone TorD family protein [Burkholderiales bacterium]